MSQPLRGTSLSGGDIKNIHFSEGHKEHTKFISIPRVVSDKVILKHQPIGYYSHAVACMLETKII